MKIHQLAFLIRESFKTVGRHKGIMFLSNVIMSLTLLVLAVFLLVTDNVLSALDRTREELNVYVYLQDGLTQQRTEGLYRQLLAMTGVEEIVFISKDDAMEEFRSEFGESRSILESLESNPLPASFKVKLGDAYKEQSETEAFAKEVGAMRGVEDVNYGKEFLDRFSFMARVFMYVDVALGLIVVLSSIFIISNTVRLTILSRQQSIEILKLVGATNRFISTPFVLEGAFQAGVASLISLLLLAVLHAALTKVLPDVSFLEVNTVAVYLATCVVLGSVGSYTALRRFLKF